ncbi:hypothetical protein RhiirC2_280485 [Rhizophagus irregularis]|uniref:Uncharacterized protein n=1 Tax=Rhizophagus irregularis TaxID=588596 RepID=A0A2N1P1D5_9GLOM|nr:hypothetical protein RhiirC2_280485 [Rhizophagus irregularis]
MKIFLGPLCISLNITFSILLCIENKSLEWQIIEVLLGLGSLLVLGFLCMGEGFLWLIWKFYNEKPWNAWLFVILFITMLLFRNEYLNYVIFAGLSLVVLVGINLQEDSMKELFRWIRILSIPTFFFSLIRLISRPFNSIYSFAVNYVMLTFNLRLAKS